MPNNFLTRVKLTLKLFVLKIKLFFSIQKEKSERLTKLKYLLIAIPIGLTVLAVVFVLYFNKSKPQFVRVANISSGSATITWHTDSKSKSVVVIKQGENFLPIETLFSTKFYDDRDGAEEENIERNTHFVTITDLDPESEYYFKVGDSSINLKSVDDIKFKTEKVTDDFIPPIPLYGSASFGENETEIDQTSDSIVYLYSENSSERKIYATLLNTDKNWVMNNPNSTEVEDNYTVELLYNGESASKSIPLSSGFQEIVKIDIDLDKTSIDLEQLAETGGSSYSMFLVDKTGKGYYCVDRPSTTCPSGYTVAGCGYATAASGSCTKATDGGKSCTPATNCVTGTTCTLKDPNNTVTMYTWCSKMQFTPVPSATPVGNLFPYYHLTTSNTGVYCKANLKQCAQIDSSYTDCGVSKTNPGGCSSKQNTQCILSSQCNLGSGGSGCKSTYSGTTYSRWCKTNTPTNTTKPISTKTPTPTKVGTEVEYPFEEIDSRVGFPKYYCLGDLPNCTAPKWPYGECGLGIMSDPELEPMCTGIKVDFCIKSTNCTKIVGGKCYAPVNSPNEVRILRYCRDSNSSATPTVSVIPKCGDGSNNCNIYDPKNPATGETGCFFPYTNFCSCSATDPNSRNNCTCMKYNEQRCGSVNAPYCCASSNINVCNTIPTCDAEPPACSDPKQSSCGTSIECLTGAKNCEGCTSDPNTKTKCYSKCSTGTCSCKTYVTRYCRTGGPVTPGGSKKPTNTPGSGGGIDGGIPHNSGSIFCAAPVSGVKGVYPGTIQGNGANQCSGQMNGYPQIPSYIKYGGGPSNITSCDSPANLNRWFGTGNDDDPYKNQGAVKAAVGKNLITMNDFLGVSITIHKNAKIPFQQVHDAVVALSDPPREGNTFYIDGKKWVVDSSTTGAYAFRNNVNTPGILSPHSFGIAIDVNWSKNPNKTCTVEIPSKVVEIFYNNGFRWGATWSDPMHFEYIPSCITTCNGTFNNPGTEPPQNSSFFQCYNGQIGSGKEATDILKSVLIEIPELTTHPPVKIKDGPGVCNSYSGDGIIYCDEDDLNGEWLTSKLLFHEAIHRNYSKLNPKTQTTEIQAGVLEAYFFEPEDKCLGSNYKFKGKDNQVYTYNTILEKLGTSLSRAELFEFALGKRDHLSRPEIISKIVDGGKEIKDIYCNGWGIIGGAGDTAYWKQGEEIPCSNNDPTLTLNYNINSFSYDKTDISNYDTTDYFLTINYPSSFTEKNENNYLRKYVNLKEASVCNGNECIIENISLDSTYIDYSSENPIQLSIRTPEYDLSSEYFRAFNAYTVDEKSGDFDVSLDGNTNLKSNIYYSGQIPINPIELPDTVVKASVAENFALSKGIYSLILNNPDYPKTLIIKEENSNLSFYEDKNSNSIKDVDEEFISSSSLSIIKSSELKSFNLSNGWNYISFDYDQDSISKASDVVDLLQMYTKDFSEIALYNKKTSSWQIYKILLDETGYQAFGENFTIEPGMGIFINYTESIPKTLYISGFENKSVNNGLELKVGLNFNSFGSDISSSTINSAYKYMNKCINNNIGCVSISSYNNKLNEVVVYENGQLSGPDFSLEPYKPYIIKVNGSGGTIKFE